MAEKGEYYFTSKDIFFEAMFTLFASKNPVRTFCLIKTALDYNAARRTGDPLEISNAYRNLSKEMQELMSNFIKLGKGHWLE